MRHMLPMFAVAVLALQFATGLQAQTGTVALTIDDLPFVVTDSSRPMRSADAKTADAANHKLLKALARHKVPVTGFVIQKNVEELGLGAGGGILRAWIQHGLDLGNHTYGHPDFDDFTTEQFEDQITRGETTFAPLMNAAGRRPEFFRFPFNHTGDTKEKRDAVAAFLAQRGYRLAPCTIENSDWMFNIAYGRMLARHDKASAARLRADYLAFTDAQVEYFNRLNRQVLGYEPPQIMLIHDNQLNADVIQDLLKIFERKQFRWVTLREAESDPAYLAPDTLITKYGPMWGFRWAKERNVKIDGSLEPDPPKWIAEYEKQDSVPPRRARTEF